MQENVVIENVMFHTQLRNFYDLVVLVYVRSGRFITIREVMDVRVIVPKRGGGGSGIW